MDELVDAYGEEFVKNLKTEISKRQSERESVSDNAKLGIADKAINEQGFGEGEMMFQYTDDETGVTHDVLLMETPDPESKTFYSMMNELDSGAVTAPLLYLGEFYSCLFNDPDMARSLEPGKWYIIVGELGQWEDNQNRIHDQVSPVRGVIAHNEALGLAEQAMEGKDINEPEPEPEETVNEPEPEVEEEESEKSGLADSPFAAGGDDDEEEEEEDDFPASQDEIDELVENFAEQNDIVWDLEDGDDHFDHLVEAVTTNHPDLDEESDSHLEGTAMMVLDRIERENEDDDEEDGDVESSMFGT